MKITKSKLTICFIITLILLITIYIILLCNNKSLNIVENLDIDTSSIDPGRLENAAETLKQISNLINPKDSTNNVPINVHNNSGNIKPSHNNNGNVDPSGNVVPSGNVNPSDNTKSLGPYETNKIAAKDPSDNYVIDLSNNPINIYNITITKNVPDNVLQDKNALGIYGYINIREIKFFNSDGNEVPQDNFTASSESIHKNDVPNNVLNDNDKFYHSNNPTGDKLTIIRKNDNKLLVNKIVIYARNDGGDQKDNITLRRRLSYLNITIRYIEDNVKEGFNNQILKNNIHLLNKLSNNDIKGFDLNNINYLSIYN